MDNPAPWWKEIEEIIQERRAEWESNPAVIANESFLNCKKLLEDNLRLALLTLQNYSRNKAQEVAVIMKDSNEGRLKKIREEAERRELVSLERRKGTEIRKASVEREALPAFYHKQVAEQCESGIIRVLEKISGLLPAEEAALFVTALTDERREIRDLSVGLGIFSLLTKLIAFPTIMNEADHAIWDSLEPIRAANRSKTKLTEEGIDVGELIPAPEVIPNDILSKIATLKLILQSLGKARAYFNWLQSLLPKASENQ